MLKMQYVECVHIVVRFKLSVYLLIKSEGM